MEWTKHAVGLSKSLRKRLYM